MHLCVEMGVPVDEAGCDDLPVRIQLALGTAGDITNGGDAPVLNCNVGPIARVSRAVDHSAIAN